MRVKTFQMPRTFVNDVLTLAEHLRAHYKLDMETIELLRSIEFEINAKIESAYKRMVYSQYKSAPPGSIERETFRRDYLDVAGIHKNLRSKDEIST